MKFCPIKKPIVPSIDLHNMSVEEAKVYIDKYIKLLPESVKEIEVIHGYRNGTKLRDFVRLNYRNKRIARKFLSLNQGVTNFILR